MLSLGDSRLCLHVCRLLHKAPHAFYSEEEDMPDGKGWDRP